MKHFILLLSVLLAFGAAKEDDETFNANSMKRSALTMQASIFERKAAMATVMVEKYKKKGDLKNAHKQYAIEAKAWKKSQELVTKAAKAHPIPNAYIARAAVQLQVATEAARVMKQKMKKEKDGAKKALNKMVYGIEQGNVGSMKLALKFAEKERKAEEFDEKALKPIESRIAEGEKMRKKELSKEKRLGRNAKKAKKVGKKKRLENAEMKASKVVTTDDTALEKLYATEEKLETDLATQADKLEKYSVGPDELKDHQVAAKAKKNLRQEKAAVTKLKKAVKDQDLTYEKILKEEMDIGNKKYLKADAQISVKDLFKHKHENDKAASDLLKKTKKKSAKQKSDHKTEAAKLMSSSLAAKHMRVTKHAQKVHDVDDDD